MYAIRSYYVDSWVAEASHYDYDTNTCDDVCGHYTQVVWRTSTAMSRGSPYRRGRNRLATGWANSCGAIE